MATKPVLTLSIVSKNEICALTMACITKATTEPKLLRKYTIQQSLSLDRSDLPKARSSALTDWYENAKKGDIFLFIDSDQVFKASDIIRALQMLKTNTVVCGAYPRKNGTFAVEPINKEEFELKGYGELYYGATGFMMMSYCTVNKIADFLGKKICISDKEKAYTFFYERIIEEDSVKDEELWLGEDYSFCWLVRNLGGNIQGFYSNSLGHIVTKDIYPEIRQSYTWPKKSIVIFCGMTAEPWSSESLSKGIGGSEAAVIHLSRYWSENGYKVTVYCNCDNVGYTEEGVEYLHTDNFNFEDHFNILIVWRASVLLEKVKFNAEKCFLDLHDVIQLESITENVLSVNKVCVKSKFHASMLGSIPEEKVAVIPNGGAYTLIGENKKDLNYLIYTSSYDRGLAYMLNWGWPKIKKACPSAYLKIYYGWEGFDSMREQNRETILYKSIICKLMEQDGVEECGRISNQELLLEKQKANIHYYTGNFQEIDCISVRESASLGAIPVVSEFMEVFKEKPYCTLIEGDPETQEMQEKAADKIIELLQNQEQIEKLRDTMTDLVSFETWDNVGEKWLELFK